MLEDIDQFGLCGALIEELQSLQLCQIRLQAA